MLNNEFPPLGGGTGTVNQAILNRLIGVPGLEVDLVTSALGKSAEKILFAENIRIFKVPVNNRIIHHSSNRELMTYAAHALPVACRLHNSQPYDFCFAWSGVPAGGVALALHRTRRLPYLVRVCGPDIPGFEHRYKGLYPILNPFIRLIWHGAEVVVAKCEGEADLIRAVDKKVNIALVPNGVDLDAFPPAGSLRDDEPLRLICVARLIERKGQPYLIEAMKRLAEEGIDVSLQLVGTGDAQAAYEKRARTLGVGGRIEFTGYVPREKIAACYGAAHVFVLPSQNEGMSVATLEAMAVGLPLVVTHTGGTAHLVEEGVNGWTFPWADVQALVSCIRRLAIDRPLARRMGAASRARAAQFSWGEAVTKYLGIFEEIAKRSLSSGRRTSVLH